MILGLAIAALAVAGIAAATVGANAPPGGLSPIGHSFVRLFLLDEEANIPTWFSSAELLVAAGLAFAVSADAGSRDLPHWRGMALLLLAMSIDETAMLHEMTGAPLRQLGSWSGLLRAGWVVPGSLLVIAVAVTYFRFWRRQPPRLRRLLFLSAALYIGGALGMEFPESLWESRHAPPGMRLYAADDIVLGLLTSVEEVLEMCGVAVTIYALLEFLGTDPFRAASPPETDGPR